MQYRLQRWACVLAFPQKLHDTRAVWRMMPHRSRRIKQAFAGLHVPKHVRPKFPIKRRRHVGILTKFIRKESICRSAVRAS
jgi:hypothetical protein